jgi:copper chaperone
MEGVARTYKFKTNIDCVSCIADIRSVLDNSPGIDYWYVEPFGEEPELTVTSQDLDEDRIIELVHHAGYKARKI